MLIHVASCVQGGAPDGSSSSSSSDEDDVVASAAGGGTQPPRQQQQQRRALAAAQMAATTAAADRARRRQEALLRLERSKALMRKVQDSTSGGLISTELRQMLSKVCVRGMKQDKQQSAWRLHLGSCSL